MLVNWVIWKMDKKDCIVIVSITIFVLCFVGTASATNWSVDGSGGADFTGIQDAINNAKDGDTILVYSGVYYENVVVDKSVTLIGNGQPVVDAEGKRSAITLTVDRITLVGFNATNSGSSWSDVGIKVTSNNNTITGNNVSNNNGGIFLNHSRNNVITGNNARYNNADGIDLESSSNNNTITGNNVSNNNGGGIGLSSSRNNTITGNNVSSNRGGIGLFYSSNNNTITGNNVSNNKEVGIGLYDSSNNNTITGNVFVNDGLSVYSSYQNTVEDNTVNGKPLVYLEDVSDYKVEDAGQIILVNCDNITVENLDLSNTSGGIVLWKTENSKISNSTVCNNRGGIGLYDSSNNTITGNNASNNNGVGIGLSSSRNNTITGNNVSNNNEEGIFLYYSSNNTITGNNVSNNNWGGIRLWDFNNNNTITGNNVSNNNGGGISLYYSSNNNTLTGNNVCNNSGQGIDLFHSSSNKIFLNNFIKNNDAFFPYKSTNIWNSTLEITYTYDGTTYKSYLGNYWDDYEGTDADGDGIGDTHYSTYSKSDDYPLMKPIENYILP